MNGVVEAANKNIKNIIGKIIETYKDWHEKLPFALYAYLTSVKTIGATPYSLVYGMEAVLPIEVKIPSLRVLSELKLDEAEWIQSRFDHLNLIEEKSIDCDVCTPRAPSSANQDPIELPKGSMTRARTKRLQEALTALLTRIWDETKPLDVGEAMDISLKTQCTLLQADFSSSPAPPALQLQLAHLSLFELV
ncbi:uncharacterized protein [Gossypium hirsutum]|uniref:Uncharacterized protein n=1 Tax=Gossypium hirsutum TaxID=3635 RepID=A0A1U8IG69_GOSHI|nr:uncharacterized protein LOC107894602 [Gossypium hirsutum]